MSTATVRPLIAAALILVSLVGCHRPPALQPRLILPGEQVGQEFWLAAPYIVVARIVSAQLEGPREPIFEGGPEVLQLVRFTADVENTIKGDLPKERLTFFFFAKTDQSPYYYLYPGRRYIVSLRREGKLLRSFADATQLAIWVHSGSHNQKDLPLGLGPEATIAYILLMPGLGYDPVVGLPDLLPYGDPGYIHQLLRELQASPNRQLRDSACLDSATMFGHRPGCLEDALKSSSSGTRKGAQDLLNDNSNLPGVLRGDPYSLFSKHWTTYMSQMFEIYTEDVRPEVRQSACTLLRGISPEQVPGHCK